MSEARDILLGRTPEEDENAGAGSPIRAALEVTQDRTPEDLLRAKALAQEAGVPEGVALADPDRVQREAVARTIEGNKRFAGWASEPDNAPFARADARALRQVYDNLLTAEEHRALLEADYNYGEKLVVALGQGANQVAVNVRANRLALLERKIQALETGEPETYRGPGGRPVQRPPRPVDPARLEKMKAEAGGLRAALVADRAADVPELGAESVLGNFGLDVARGAPQFLGSIAASLVGTPALGTAFMGSQIAGGQYLDLTEDGVSPDRALKAGLANAALQAPLEAINLGRFVKLLKAKGAVGRVLRAGEQTVSEVATETLQAIPELATDIWARAEKDGLGFADQAQKFADELPGALKRGAYEGLTLAPFALIGGLGGAVRAHREERNAQNFVERQLGLHADVDGTLTKKYAPGVLQAALMHSGPEMRQLVSLPVAELLTLRQAGTDILTPLGLSLEEVQTEAAKGGETGVAVPMAALHARLDADRFKAAAKIMRRSAEADSLTEAGKNGESTLANLKNLAGAHAAGAGLLDQEQANSELRARLRRGEAPAPSVASQPESVEGGVEVAGEAIIGETAAEAPAAPEVVYAKADVLEAYFQTAAQQMPEYDTEVLRADLLEGLGITPEAWEEAMTGGGDLEI
ncbi:MAG: hypothetical protein LBV21_01655, partial [Candidatus Adiutrix sp.]|nr:hypothetical protein [Candidatus Adiutrix sp.]